MEATGVVFRQAKCLSSATADAGSSRHSNVFPTMRKPNSFCPKQRPVRKSFAAFVVSGEFTDKSHLQYYDGPRVEVKEKEEIASKKKEMKKKLKLLKGLSKNLSTFSDLGLCLNPDTGLYHQVKSQMISEATEVLLGQLQKLKEEKMEYKRMKKETKAKKKASCKDSSSSSESSSESDCDNNVVTMTQLKPAAATENGTTTDQELKSSIPEKAVNMVTENGISSKVGMKLNSDCGKKIEVCMGGKCKKSGATMILENLQTAVAGEVEVVGCKCMGKCRDGPNVMVRGGEVALADSLCVGVGVEDVGSIVTGFFGGSRRLGSGMVPALSSA